MSYFSEQQMVFHSIFSDECIFSVETSSMQGETEKTELPDIFIITYCTLFGSNNFRSKTLRGASYY